MNTFAKLTEARNLLDQVVSQHVGSVPDPDLPAEALASKQQMLSGLTTDKEVIAIVHAINALAMANADVIHVFTSFSAHVNKFSVHANATDTCYQEPHHHIRLLNQDVWLDDKGSLEKLLSIESQLTELIIEARDEAEANAELVPCNMQQ